MGRGLFLLLAVATGFLYAESSKLGKLTSEILNDLQLIVRSYKYLNICNPPLKNEWVNPFGVQKLYTTHWVVYKNSQCFYGNNS